MHNTELNDSVVTDFANGDDVAFGIICNHYEVMIHALAYHWMQRDALLITSLKEDVLRVVMEYRKMFATHRQLENFFINAAKESITDHLICLTRLGLSGNVKDVLSAKCGKKCYHKIGNKLRFWVTCFN